MTARYVIFRIEVFMRVQSKMQIEAVLSFKAFEIAVIQLRKDYNNGCGLLDSEPKFLMVGGAPRDINASPFLSQSPFWFQEESSAINNLKFSKKVFVRNPTDTVNSLLVAKLFQGFCGPLFGTVTPSSFP
jgi:hypothetical protein